MIGIKPRYWIFASVACFILANASGQFIAQATSPFSQTDASKQFANQLWNYLLSNNYKHWSPAPGNEAKHYFSHHKSTLGASASNRRPQVRHGAFVKSYVNRIVVGNAGALPVGSIVILENYHDDKSLESISVMYKTEGFNPDANDWYWVKYNPDGSVAIAPNEGNQIVGQKTVVDSNGTPRTHASRIPAKTSKLKGRIQSCIQCHQTALGGDLVFFNDMKTDRRRTSEKRGGVGAFTAAQL